MRLKVFSEADEICLAGDWQAVGHSCGETLLLYGRLLQCIKMICVQLCLLPKSESFRICKFRKIVNYLPLSCNAISDVVSF